MYNIKDLIGYCYIVREKIRAEDKDGLWDYCCPRVKTTEENISKWEYQNRLELPQQYREFLLAADGWPHVVQNFDLFGLEQLSFAEENIYIQCLGYCIDNISNVGDKSKLLPIGASDNSYDLYLLVLDKCSKYYGQVLWVAGEEVERHDDFNLFFLSIIEYNKLNYKLLTGKSY